MILGTILATPRKVNFIGGTMKITIDTEDKPLEDVKIPIEMFVGLLECLGYDKDSIKKYINTGAV